LRKFNQFNKERCESQRYERNRTGEYRVLKKRNRCSEDKVKKLQNRFLKLLIWRESYRDKIEIAWKYK